MLGRIFLVRFNGEITSAPFFRWTSFPSLSVRTLSTRISRYRSSAPLTSISAFSGTLGCGDGIIFCTTPGSVVLGFSSPSVLFPRLGGFQFGELVHEGRDVLAPLIYHLRLFWSHSQEGSFFQAVILQFEKGVDLLFEFFDGARGVRWSAIRQNARAPVSVTGLFASWGSLGTFGYDRLGGFFLRCSACSSWSPSCLKLEKLFRIVFLRSLCS